MEHFKPIVELIKVSIEKYGLWQTVAKEVKDFKGSFLKGLVIMF